MRIKPLAAALASAFAATILLAQEPAPKPAPGPSAKPRPGSEKPEARAEKEPPRANPAQLANVRVDVKIIDERGGQPAITKTISLTVADRNNGSIRASADAPAKGENSALPAAFRSVPLNVDAGPIIEGNRIRLQLGLEYNSVDPKLELKQRLGLVLEDGKPLRVAQSADPLTDRRVGLEVTATILR
jgi:hypothetical protein